MDVASSQLLSDTPFNPLISCSFFVLRLTARSRGETAGALPAGGERGGEGGTVPVQLSTIWDAVGWLVGGWGPSGPVLPELRAHRGRRWQVQGSVSPTPRGDIQP